MRLGNDRRCIEVKGRAEAITKAASGRAVPVVLKEGGKERDRILGQFLSAVKETFTTLYYPTRQGSQDVLNPADFLMTFEGNNYRGEDQILQVLEEKQKFTDDVSSDIFRKKVEARLFTVPVMLWSEVRKRAAINPQWQWHRRDALDALKEDLVHKEVWREDESGYVDRSPPAPKTTTVQIQERTRNEDTGVVELRITPVFGDIVYAEIGGEVFVDPAVASNLRVVSHALQQSIRETWGPAATPRDLGCALGVDIDAEDDRGARHDRGELLGRVVVETKRHPEAVPQRTGQQAGASRRADQRESRQV
jgi:hypothetical protein